MALIGSIRKKKYLLFVVLMFAISLFVIAMKFENGGGQNQKAIVGEINGVEIDYIKFNQKLEFDLAQANQNAAQSGKTLQEYEINQVKTGVWQHFISENTILAEAKKLGLAVTNAEVIDMVQGNNIIDQVKNSFTDQATGQFDRSKVIEFLQNIAKADPNNEQAQMMKASWLNFEKNLPDFRLQEKYSELFTKSIYVTKAELEKNNFAMGSKVVVKQVYIPYTSIVDSTVKVSDEIVKEYFNSHKKQFTVNDDQAYIDYVQFAYTASKEDSAKAYSDIVNLAPAFQASTNDSAFVTINSSSSNNIQSVKPTELPFMLTRYEPSPKEGAVYGPYIEYENYKLYKVGPLKQDDLFTIKASHILFKPNGNTAADTADALNRCNQVLARIKKGESFEVLAGQFGTDATKDKGGDLGQFQENQMVPEFNDAVFKKGTVGLLDAPVKTQFGYHIIKITEPKSKSTNRIIFTVEKSIKPSTQTKDKIVAIASNFKKQVADASIDELLKKPEFVKLTKMNNIQVSKQGGFVGSLSNAESIIRWAYDEKTEVSDVSDFQLPSGKVVAVLTKFKKKGEAKFEDVKEEVLPFARNMAKGDMIIAKIKQLKSNSVEELGNAYGVQAQIKLADTLSFSNGGMGLANDPILLGKVFGLKNGKKLEATKGEFGVVVAEKIADMPAQPLADYTMLKQNAKQNQYYKNLGGIGNALNEMLGVKDYRFLFY